MMKIAINLFLWTSFVSEEYFYIFENLKAVGYDGVEVPIFSGDEGHYKKLAKAIKNAGLACTAGSACLPDANIISLDASIRQKGIDWLKHVSDLASIIDADVLCGPLSCPPGIFSGHFPTSQEKTLAADGLREIGEHAQSLNLKVSVEYLNHFESYLHNTMADTVALVRQVEHPNVGIHLDTHHAHLEEASMTDAIHKGAGYINHVQVSESNRGPLGNGMINFEEVIKGLKGIGYDDWISLEAFNYKDPDIRKALFLWRELFKTPEEVYMGGIKYIKQFL